MNNRILALLLAAGALGVTAFSTDASAQFTTGPKLSDKVLCIVPPCRPALTPRERLKGRTPAATPTKASPLPGRKPVAEKTK